MTRSYQSLSKAVRAVAFGLALFCGAQVGAAQADVIYDFSFTNLTGSSGSISDFTVSVTVPDYITVTGLAPLGNPISTPLYTINNFGTNSTGWFGFSESGGNLSDGTMGHSITSFVFIPSSPLSNYITAPGIFSGGISGNDGRGSLIGLGSLVVSEVAPVPGPIVGAGLPGLVMAFGGFLTWKRRKAARAA